MNKLLFFLVIMKSSALILQKTALVTGGTDGIGLTTSKNLARQGWRVIVHGRDEDRIKKACSKVREEGSFASAVPCMADLSSIAGCKQLAETVITACLHQSTQLDLIVNNAGVFSQKKHLVGELELEETFAVNVLSPFIITSLLLPLLTTRHGSRILFTSSISQCSRISNWDDIVRCENGYSGHAAYSNSKLLDAMLSMEFADRLRTLGSHITVNTLDPGTVNTKMLLDGWGACGIDVEDALDQTWLSTSSDLDQVTGKYFVGRQERKAGSAAYDLVERKKLWNLLCSLSPTQVLQEWNNLSN